jgi:PAS domain-containing protein
MALLCFSNLRNFLNRGFPGLSFRRSGMGFRGELAYRLKLIECDSNKIHSHTVPFWVFTVPPKLGNSGTHPKTRFPSARSKNCRYIKKKRRSSRLRRGKTMGVLHQLFSSGAFTPHGYCYLWNPRLVGLNAVSDALIALAYFSIPITLAWFVMKRRDLPFSWMFALFGVFILACGSTHATEVWNIWHGNYWLAGVLKAITAVVSVSAAVLLTQLVPQAIDLPNLSQWTRLTANLQKEIRDRKEIEVNLRISEGIYREQAELIELTHDAIFVRGLRGEILFWNKAAERLYGWTKDEVRGRITHEILQTQFPKPLPEIEAQIFETGYWEGN